MAKAVIGGKEYIIPELNFIALERAWPFVEIAITTLDPMKGPSAAISIIAAGLMEAEEFDPTDFGIEKEEKLNSDEVFDRVVHFLKKQLKSSEIQNVRECVNQITDEAGLTSEEDDPSGEAQAPEEEASPSTETAPATSPSSSLQDAREEAGTA